MNDQARKKAWKPKVKTGCITCRIRRVKCDEAKPNCNRCSSTGRICDGYSPPPPQSNQVSFPARGSPLPAIKPGLQLDTVEEKEAFHFFENQTVFELSGFFDSPFWKCELLQAAHTQPAIQYAIIGLGAMHRKYIAGSSTNVPDDSSDKQIRFALQQSNRAIQEILNKPTKRNNTDRITMMTACILFDCLACLQGHQAQALEHLRSGIKLLREVDDNMDDRGEPAIAHAVSLNSLRAVFVNLDVQARSIMSDVDHANWEPQPKHDYDVNIISFSSLKDARHYFEATINDVLAFLQDLEVHPPGIEGMDTVDRTFSRLRYQFESGSRMLDEFLGRASPRIDVQRDQSFIALRLLHAQLELLVKTFDEWEGVRVLNWHIEEQHFHTMMDLITQLMESKTESLDNSPIPGGSARPGQPLERPVFSSGFGLLAGLWMVSIRAPNVSLRWKAIGYLLDYPRREGFWDGTVAGRIAWEVMTLEETATMEELGILRADLPFAVRKAADIPDYLRIRDIAIKYTGLRGATVEFRNTRHVERKESGWARNMTW